MGAVEGFAVGSWVFYVCYDVLPRSEEGSPGASSGPGCVAIRCSE
jgi:hypothetical protein